MKRKTLFLQKSKLLNSGALCVILFLFNSALLYGQTNYLSIVNEGCIGWTKDYDYSPVFMQEHFSYTFLSSDNSDKTLRSRIIFNPPVETRSAKITFTVSGLDAAKVELYSDKHITEDGTYIVVYDDFDSTIDFLSIRYLSDNDLLTNEDMVSFNSLRISNINMDIKNPIVSPVNISLNSMYDIDGDGKKEFFKTEGNYIKSYFLKDTLFYTFKDSAIVEVPSSSYYYNNTYVFNGNNDSLPDFGFIHNQYSKSADIMLLSSQNGYKSVDNSWCRNWDINADGLPDLYSVEDGISDDNRFIHYQLGDGSFQKSKIKILETQEWQDLLNSNSSGYVSDPFDMFVGSAVDANSGTLDRLETEIDFNMDGLPDLMSEENGGILLNLGDNQFAYGFAQGKVIAKDLNGDYLPDLILYDEKAKTVKSRIYLGNNEVQEQTLLKNQTISNVWCYDFDRDNDVDVLIPLNYQLGMGYSFLIFCENIGKGKFKIHENYYTDQWQFVQCGDVNNDGYIDLVAMKLINASESNTDLKKGSFYLFTGKEGLQFNEPYRFYTTTNSFYVTSSGVIESLLQDFDNDGIYELAFTTEYLYDQTPSTKIYNFTDTVVNQAPDKPTTPEFIINSETGKLKVSWPVGSDHESSAVDLTYSLRIGSAPGKNDIWFSGANPNGSRVTFTQGNMGSNLSKTIDVSGWQPGNYYISIQTVDPMFKGSEFSDEIVYSHEAVSPKFKLSDYRIYEVDTLTISLAGKKMANYTYNWEIENGHIVEENDFTLKVVFDNAGEKTISLQLENANGDVLPSSSQQITVLSNKFINKLVGPYGSLLDIDSNGALDGLFSEGGIFENNGKGDFTKIPKLYNSDLTSIYLQCVLDYNMDGLPDFFADCSKGNIFVNRGEMNLDILNENLTLYPTIESSYDINHDGYIDFTNNGIAINSGDNISFNILENTAAKYVCDFNNDGNWDFINVSSTWKDTLSTKLFIQLNKGNGTFETPKVIDISNTGYYYDGGYNSGKLYFEDMNNDGFVDIVTTISKNLVILYGDKANNRFDPPVVICDNTYIEAIRDIDNNGFKDLILRKLGSSGWGVNTAIAYFYPGNESTVVQLKDNSDLLNCIYNDINGDSVPDFRSSIRHFSKIKNNFPDSPTNIRVKQVADKLVVEWDPAFDKETPYVQMRYNISIKKKSASVGDENAFIISPLNALKDEAAVVPGYNYQSATRFEVPLSRFETGKEYEIQIQSIDLWNAHSPMSAPLTFTDLEGISIQEETCTDSPVTLEYRGTETGTITWNLDGATVVNTESNKKQTVQWSTAGVKTIKASIGSKTYSGFIKINAAKDLTFKLPAFVIAGAPVSFELPELVMLPKAEYSFRTSSDDQISNRISIKRREGTREATVTFPNANQTYQWIELVVNDSVCGEESYRQTVEVKAGIATPKISLVNIDETSGKNKVIWDKNNVNLTSDVTEMLIYKEGSKYNQFNVIGSVNPAIGEFIDYSSNPQITTSRYCIAYNTVYDAQSAKSTPHRSTHLMLNKGMGSSINLYWTAYEGAIIESYRIYRGLTPESMTILTEIPGSANSYTDLTPPDGLFYYAIEYNQVYSTIWNDETILKSKALLSVGANDTWVTGRSNAVSVVNAQNITLAQSINIMVSENSDTLSESQQELHLYTEIFPVSADYKNVNWLVTSGQELAYVNSLGVLVATGNKQGGSVSVQATTIDGSNITSTRVFTVEGFKDDDTGIDQPFSSNENNTPVVLYPNPVNDYLYFKSNVQVESISIYDLIGLKLYSSTVNQNKVNVSSLSSGTYIISLKTTDGVYNQKVMKK